MRTLLLALATPDTGPLRAAIGAALGASSVDVCQAVEAAVTWLENRPCDVLAITGPGAGVAEAVTRVRRVSRALPVLAIVPDVATSEAGAAWLAGADDVITPASLSAAQLPEGLDEVRHPERGVLRRTQRLWYAGPGDALRQHLVTRVGTRFRDVGLTGEGLAGLTTQDVEDTHSAALVVNAAQDPGALVLGIRRVKRTYPSLAITVVADGAHHDALRRAGAGECVAAPADVDHVLHAVGRAQGQCRATIELDAVRARETRLRALLEQLPEAVVLVSPEHAVLAVNLAALRVLGAQDPRQVLGASLTQWLAPDDAHAPDVVTLVEDMGSVTSREVVMRTKHLAEARRLQLRAVSFQRESGGAPAALIVLREVPPVVETPAPAAAPTDALEHERRAWDDERAALDARADALAAEVAELRLLDEKLRTAQEELSTLRDEAAELPQLRAVAARLDALGVDVDALPALLDAAHGSETRAFAESELDDLRLSAARLATIEAEELPALRAAAAAHDAGEQAMAAALAAARERIAELETTVVDLREHGAGDAAVGSPPTAECVPAASVVLPNEQQRLLQEIAGLGIVRTGPAGDVLESDDRAAHLCGFADAAALRRAGTVPTPLLAAAGADTADAVRFEVCLQHAGTATPRWLAGARVVAVEAGEAVHTWLLAERDDTRARAARQGDRQQTMSAVLEAATAECRTLVESAATRVVGPRPVDETGQSAHSVGARSLARAQAMLAQLSSFGRRRVGQLAAHDLGGHLASLRPVLERLATDDLDWRLNLPDEPIHACVAPTEFERCVTAMVAIGRDALPVGGQLTLTLAPADEATVVGNGNVRRPEAALVLEAQGYGLTDLAVTGTLRDVATAMGAEARVTSIDNLGARLTLRLTRAFVMTHVA